MSRVRVLAKAAVICFTKARSSTGKRRSKLWILSTAEKRSVSQFIFLHSTTVFKGYFLALVPTMHGWQVIIADTFLRDLSLLSSLFIFQSVLTFRCACVTACLGV